MDINLDQGLTEPTGELNSIDIKRYFYLLRSYWWVYFGFSAGASQTTNFD